MADYFAPTVVQPTIPAADMTPLERLVLGHMFDAEPDGDGLYFFAETSPGECLALAVADLRAAHRDSADVTSILNHRIAECLAETDVRDTHVELDLTDISWSSILQDIVRRSPTLDHVAVITSFTCTKMRPDGFGGMATLITATAIRVKSTNDILEEFHSEDERGDGDRLHILLRFSEGEVRPLIAEVIANDEALTALRPDAVSDDDIRTACLAVVQGSDLADERGSALFRAALAAIREAERRIPAGGPT
jgi:hypothetical protein